MNGIAGHSLPKGSLSNGSRPSSTSEMDDFFHMSLQSIGQDMSLEEAISRVKELMKENKELKDTVHTNNGVLKQQFEIMEEWKDTQNREREEIKEKYEQARVILGKMREQLENKDKKIDELERKVMDVTSGGEVSKESNEELRKKIGDLTIQNQELGENKKFMDLKVQELTEELENIRIREVEPSIASINPDDAITDLHRKIKDLNQAVRELKSVNRDLNARNEKYETEIFSLKEANSKYIKECENAQQTVKKMSDINERLLAEKRDLTNMNTELQNELETAKARQAAAAATKEPENLQMSSLKYMPGLKAEDYVVVTERQPAGDAAMEEVRKEKLMNSQMLQHKQEKAMSGLLTQMQEERQAATEIKGQLSEKIATIEKLTAEVWQKDQRVKELEAKHQTTVSQLTENHQRKEMQLLTLIQEMKQNKDNKPITDEELGTLRSQVTSLIQENARTESSLKSYKERCTDLQSQLASAHMELESQRNTDDQIMESMRVSILNAEQMLTAEKQEGERNRIELQKCRQKIAQMEEDSQQFEEMFKTYQQNQNIKVQSLERKANQGLPQAEAKKFQDHIDTLTAQLFTAEETIGAKDDKLKNLEQKMKEAEEFASVWKTQAEIFQNDFEQERKAREEMHSEKERLKEELKFVNDECRGLEKQLGDKTKGKVATLGRRYDPEIGVNLGMNQNRPYEGGILNNPYEEEDYGRGRGGQEYVPKGGSPMKNEERYPPQQQKRRSYPQQYEVATEHECPQCGRKCPDLDSLQIHVIECIPD